MKYIADKLFTDIDSQCELDELSIEEIDSNAILIESEYCNSKFMFKFELDNYKNYEDILFDVIELINARKSMC